MNAATTAWLTEHRERFASVMNRLERSLDVTLTSATRSVSENLAAGGDPWSQHLYSLARDYVGPEITELASRAEIEGFIPVFGTSARGEPYVHIQALPAGTLEARLAQDRPDYPYPEPTPISPLVAPQTIAPMWESKHVPLGRSRILGCRHRV